MIVSLWIRETVGGKRAYIRPNKKKLYPSDTVFCLRYSIDGKRRWETLDAINLNAALAARATKEAALLSAVPAAASAPAKRVNVDDAMATYLSTIVATRAHKTWLAYNLILNEFRKTCAKENIDQIDKADLTAFVVAQKKGGQDDRNGRQPPSGSRNLLTGARNR
ncbi:MAG: hypothetical protein ABSE82_09340 [Nitrososphaerales archaeon]|jgi:hypothetical protein